MNATVSKTEAQTSPSLRQLVIEMFNLDFFGQPWSAVRGRIVGKSACHRQPDCPYFRVTFSKGGGKVKVPKDIYDLMSEGDPLPLYVQISRSNPGRMRFRFGRPY